MVCLLLLGLGALFGKQRGVDVREYTTRSNSNLAEQLVQLLVVADSELDVARNNARLLVVAGGVASELKNFCSQVLKNCCEVYGSTGADARSDACILDEARYAAYWELQARLGAARDSLRATRLLSATTCGTR